MEIFMQAAILITGIAGQLFVAKRSHRGFYWWLLSNALLIIVSIHEGMYGMVLLYSFYSFMCLYSIRKWRSLDAALPRTA